MFKKIFKNKATVIMMSVICFLLVVVIVANVLIFSMFQTLFNFAFGGPEAVYADGVTAMYPATKSSNKQEAFQRANEMNIALEEEGAVLLKNENALPLKKNAKVSVFGKNSVNLSYGSSGSSGGDISDAKTLYDGLAEAEFECNPTLKAFYEDTKRSGPVREANSSDLDTGDSVMVATAETPQSRYTDDVKNSYAQYNDAAIVVITRIGGEGWDLPRTMKGMEGARKDDDHYLQLDQNETDLLKAVCEADFEHVIVLLNIPSTMEAGFLTDPDYYAYQSKIDACLWMGFPGREGTVAIGRILSGEVNPSGHTADTWGADFTKDPTYRNFGDNNVAGGDKYNNVVNPETGINYYFVDYEEGVYVGYRYYETRAAQYGGAIEAIGEETYENGEDWYEDAVVYPFGYGLSYTTFEWSVRDDSALRNVTIEKGKKYTIKVDVTNTGSTYAGKDVVQLYVNAPYTSGGIEKPYVVLAGFAKTDIIQPQETKTVEITIDPYYFASYDYADKNKNGIMGYELEGGDYNLFISHNSHDHEFTVPFSVATGGIAYEEDPVTGEYIENRYTDYGPWPSSDAQLSTVLSRNDWSGTFPDSPTDAERNLEIEGGQSIKDDLLASGHNNFTDFEALEMPSFEVKGSGLTFRDFLPAEAPEEETYEPIVDYYDERWEDFLDMCSVNEMKSLLYYAAYETAAMSSVGVPMTKMYDGPTGFTNFANEGAVYDVATYCSEPVVASTWNAELVEEFGETMGEEGIWGNAKSGMPYTGIYAPGANIHRSPFGGRCGEYFSEDSLLSGKMAAAEIRGLQKKGVVAAIKHFAANEQETHRSINGDSSWLTEQSLREIYLRPFEIAVKEGKARAVMSSFNRIGTRWTGGDYRLLTEILRDEWGFKGFVVSDFNTCPEYMHAEQMAYAGGDLNLATVMYNGQDWCNSSDKADLIILRQSVKNVLYTLVNSNAMNGEVIGYKMAPWQIVTIVIDCVVVAGLAVWGFFAIRGALKKSKAAESGAENGQSEA